MANYTKLKVIWKNNLNNIYKENTIIGVGQEAVINFSEEGISNIYVNFEVNGEVYTDLVKIKGNTINVPFKTDVLKVGTHKLEIVAYLRNGDVIPSPTFNYYVEDAIENPDGVTAETHYPLLIELLEEVGEYQFSIKYKGITKYGKNTLPKKKKDSVLKIFLIFGIFCNIYSNLRCNFL